VKLSRLAAAGILAGCATTHAETARVTIAPQKSSVVAPVHGTLSQEQATPAPTEDEPPAKMSCGGKP